jgi:hypothetical protein
MADRNITITVKGIPEVKKALKTKNINILKAVDFGVYKGAVYLKIKVKEAIRGHGSAPSAVKSTHFVTSVYAKKKDYFVAEVGSKAPYAKFLEFGTSPHFIAPTNKKALYWKSGAGKFFSKGHEVDGIKPRRYFGNTAMREKKNVTKIIADEIKIAIDK